MRQENSFYIRQKKWKWIKFKLKKKKKIFFFLKFKKKFFFFFFLNIFVKFFKNFLKFFFFPVNFFFFFFFFFHHVLWVSHGLYIINLLLSCICVFIIFGLHVASRYHWQWLNYYFEHDNFIVIDFVFFKIKVL